MDNSERDDCYSSVPGQGNALEDGTWWTNGTASVGTICTTQYYWRKVVGDKYWASDKRSKCIEAADFGGKPFRRWQELPQTEYRPCVYYADGSLTYEA